MRRVDTASGPARCERSVNAVALTDASLSLASLVSQKVPPTCQVHESHFDSATNAAVFAYAPAHTPWKRSKAGT